MRNPIFKREEMLMNRGYNLTLMITLINTVMGVLVLLNLYSVSQRAMATGEIRYTTFLDLYHVIAISGLLLLLLLGPALTASSISGERERKTLGMLLTTQLTPWDIVFGKFLTAISTVGVLIFSTLPVAMTAFIYGGVSMKELLYVLVVYFVAAVFSASVGMFFSSLSKTTATAIGGSYSMLFLLTVFLMYVFVYVELPRVSDTLLLFLVAIFFLFLSFLFLWVSQWRITPGHNSLFSKERLAK